MKNSTLIVAAIVLLSVAVGRADEIVILERTANHFDSWAATPGEQERVLSAISQETGVPSDTLAAQRERTGLGYGGVFIGNSLANATGKSFDEIAEMKASGHGWGWIAKQNNVKLGPIVSQARHADKALRNSNAKTKKAKKSKVQTTSHNKGHGHHNTAQRTHSSGNGHSYAAARTAHGSHGGFHSGGHGKGH